VSKNKYREHLRRVPIFAGCSNKQIDEVATIVTELPMPAGAVIMHEGGLAHEFVIIEKGTASVKRGGKKVATLGPGDFVGELALVLHRPRNATVKADTDMTLLIIDARSFKKLLDTVPGLSNTLLATVAERLADGSKPAALLH